MKDNRKSMEEAARILGIKEDAPQEQVRKAYMSLVKRCHPDINNSEDAHKKMLAINKAYEAFMRTKFKIADPWEDYSSWWAKQYGKDPFLTNVSAEEYGKSKRYAGVKRDNDEKITDQRTNKDIVDEFLDKRNVFAVIGVSKNPKKHGNKVYKELKWAGYIVYPVNPKLDIVEGDKCYASLSDLPIKPDVIDIVVPSDITEKIVKEAATLGIDKIWMQPGSESEKAIECCKKNGISALHNICIMLENKARK